MTGPGQVDPAKALLIAVYECMDDQYSVLVSMSAG